MTEEKFTQTGIEKTVFEKVKKEAEKERRRIYDMFAIIIDFYFKNKKEVK